MVECARLVKEPFKKQSGCSLSRSSSKKNREAQEMKWRTVIEVAKNSTEWMQQLQRQNARLLWS